uniref:Uncharacterized protein n=1 Tax=Amphimedon queenslandica TaxID=400682 RepID=A0A1X7UTF7_AMPQE
MASKSRPKELRDCLSNSCDPTLTALRCLSYFLSPKLKKKASKESQYSVVPYILMEAPRGTLPNEVIDKTNNFPYILRLFDAEDEIDPQYFVAVEQQILFECKDVINALFHLISTYYVFNMSYHGRVQDILYFIQEKVLDIKDSTTKKSSMYLSVTLAIECYDQQDVNDSN